MTCINYAKRYVLHPFFSEVINRGLTWCVFVRSSFYMCTEVKPTRSHWKVYYTYNMLNIFRAILWASSGARDYIYFNPAYGVQCLVAGCRASDAGQQTVHPGSGMLHNVQHPSCGTHSLLLCTWLPTTSKQALHTKVDNNTNVVSSSWWWA